MLEKWTHFHVVEKRDWFSVMAWTGGMALIATLLAAYVIFRSRRAAYHAVQQSQDQLANAQRMAQLGSWQWSASDDSMVWSDEGSHIIDLMHGNRINRKGYLKIVHPEDRVRVAKRWDQAMEDGVYQSEHRLLLHGEEKWVKEIAEMHADHRGKITDASGTTQDIHEQKINEFRVQENAAELQQLTGKLLSVQEEERRRVARELHDDLSQRLAALSIEAGNFELDPELVAGQERIGNLKAGLIQIATDVHGLSRRLHPSILDDLGLVDALRSEIDSYVRRESIQVELQVSSQLPELAADLQLSIFRIVQEALRNVAKYSEANRAQVSLHLIKQLLVLQVSDDGMGFDVAEAMKSPGLGLQSMTERAKLIGGEIHIHSEINRGTRIELQVPLS